MSDKEARVAIFQMLQLMKIVEKNVSFLEKNIKSIETVVKGLTEICENMAELRDGEFH